MNLKNWIGQPSPKSMNKGNGWVRELDRVWVNQDRTLCVMARDIETAWGKVTHVCIKNAEQTDIPWAEKQQIKNEIFGEDKLAIEVFPAEDQLVDAAMMYHIWILPEGFKLPFTLKEPKNG